MADPGSTCRSAAKWPQPGADGSGRRPSRARRGAALVPVALATAALIAACGSSSNTTSGPTGKKLDMARIVGSIEESFLTKRGIHAHVVCPTSEEQRAGNNFVCTATGVAGTGSNKKPFTVHVGVTQTNNNGYVTYVSY